MPFTPDAKSPGDLIRSADWNEAMTEIVRLDTDKVNKAGDTMTGALNIRNILTITGEANSPLTSRINFREANNAAPNAMIASAGTTGTGNPGDLLFLTDGSAPANEKMRITTTGRLGIGTPTPQSRLHVTGNITTDWGLTINHFNGGFGANETRPWLRKAWSSTFGDFLSISSSGNRSNEEQSALIVSGNGIFMGRGHDAGDQLSVEWLRINSTGNLGLGKTNPEHRLDITGNLQLSGSLYFKFNDSDNISTRIFKGNYGFIIADGRTRLNAIMDHNPNLSDNPYTFGVGHTYFTNSGGAFFLSGIDYKFRVDSDGRAYADTNFTGGGADYADLFESHNGKEIASGTAVVLTDDGKIRKAKKNETPIGVVTQNPALLGNNPMEWHKKFLRDEFGNKIMEKFEDLVPISKEAEEKIKSLPKSKLKSKTALKDLTKVIKGTRPKLNPDYDPEKAYIPRVVRPEWQAVGLIGQLHLIKGQAVAPSWIKIKDVSEKVELWLVK